MSFQIQARDKWKSPVIWLHQLKQTVPFKFAKQQTTHWHYESASVSTNRNFSQIRASWTPRYRCRIWAKAILFGELHWTVATADAIRKNSNCTMRLTQMSAVDRSFFPARWKHESKLSGALILREHRDGSR